MRERVLSKLKQAVFALVFLFVPANTFASTTNASLPTRIDSVHGIMGRALSMQMFVGRLLTLLFSLILVIATAILFDGVVMFAFAGTDVAKRAKAKKTLRVGGWTVLSVVTMWYCLLSPTLLPILAFVVSTVFLISGDLRRMKAKGDVVKIRAATATIRRAVVFMVLSALAVAGSYFFHVGNSYNSYDPPSYPPCTPGPCPVGLTPEPQRYAGALGFLFPRGGND